MGDAVCQMPHGGAKFLCQIPYYSPTEPKRGVVGQYIDRCINIQKVEVWPKTRPHYSHTEYAIALQDVEVFIKGIARYTNCEIGHPKLPNKLPK